MTDRVSIEAIPNIPFIEPDNDVADILIRAISEGDIRLEENDIICVASKAVSMAENREVALKNIDVSEVAERVHSQVPRKDPRTIQLMINETGDPGGKRLIVTGDHIAGWLPSGLRLTSAGVDKVSEESVILLPKDADASARAIGKKILDSTGINVAVLITDSDGREDKKGATQIAVGIYGISPIRITNTTNESGKKQTSEETLCDMLAASAALIMGQRGNNKPAVLVRGVDYNFDERATIDDALH